MVETLYKSLIISTLFPKSLYDAEYLIQVLNEISDSNFYNTVEFYFEGSDEDRALIKQALLKYKLDSVFLAGYPLKMNQLSLGDLDPAKRKQAIDSVINSIDQAYYYGSKKMLILSGKNYIQESDHKQSIEELEESVIELCSYAKDTAEDYVLDVTLEPFNDKGEPFFLIGPTGLTAEFAERVTNECNNFQLTFDLSHAVQLGEDPVESLSCLYKYVKHIHIANCVMDPTSEFFGDKHPPINFKGGEIFEEDIYRFISHASKLGFFNQVSMMGIEIITPQNSNELDLYRETTKIFKKSLLNIDQLA
jgi:sugar phosphate isomerase/epimerase